LADVTTTELAAVLPRNGHGLAALPGVRDPALPSLANGSANGTSKRTLGLLWLPRAAEPFARQQVREFAELAHRRRVPSLADHLAIGTGEWISTAMAQSIALVLCQRVYSGATSPEQLTDLLMECLADPGKRYDPEGSLFELPIVTHDGRILLDVSMSGDQGAQVEFRLIQARHGAGGSADVTGTGALICGPAVEIAGGRPFLDVDVMVSYARRKVFRHACEDDPGNAPQAMRAAEDLEVVVMLDPSARSAVWIDVDPVTGDPAAVLAIDLSGLNEAQQNGSWKPFSIREIVIPDKRNGAGFSRAAQRHQKAVRVTALTVDSMRYTLGAPSSFEVSTAVNEMLSGEPGELTLTEPRGRGFFHVSMSEEGVTVGCSTVRPLESCLGAVLDVARRHGELLESMSDGAIAWMAQTSGPDGFDVVTGSADVAENRVGDLPGWISEQIPGDTVALRVDVGGAAWQWDDLGADVDPDVRSFGGLTDLKHFDALMDIMLTIGDRWVRTNSALLVGRVRHFVTEYPN
jgi:hypothetical protein